MLTSLALALSLSAAPAPVAQAAPADVADVAEAPAADPLLDAALERAGDNRAELEAALDAVPADQRPSMAHLVRYMPTGDLRTLTADYLVEHVTYAHRARDAAPWSADMPDEVFLDHVLPYASINERRDAWRKDFFERFSPLVAGAETASDAAALLNQKVFPMVEVIYSTQRPKADQSPYESIDAGMASCTGLSVLLIDACRAVGVPARFVGTPLWSDGSGNHSWVEVWDGRWRITGAAEPTGMDLDKAWFLGRASTATPGRHGIYAVSFRPTPLRLPMVWKPEADEVWAVDVTERYTAEPVEVPEGMARVRFRTLAAPDGTGRRVRVATDLAAWPRDGSAMPVTTKDERYDANDHAEVLLPLGAIVDVYRTGDDEADWSFEVEADEQLVTLHLDVEAHAAGASPAVASATGSESAAGARATGAGGAATQGLTRAGAERVARELWEARAETLRAERKAEVEARELVHGEARMPFWYSVHGEAPEGGRSLYISMHGGGGAPAAVNDRQWENQKRLYRIDEGVYVAPRAPTDTWNLWHQGHVDPLFDRLITDMVLFEGVDPDRVYLLGYSAGGDGVFQLAPRMADRYAAAAMMAGHPNETRPDGLRNLPFTLWMGASDGAYDRNKKAAEWEAALADLRAGDAGGYDHRVEILAGKGHWMDGEDAAALPWMAERTRDPRPERIVWLQDDVTHDRFYWLQVDAPVARSRVVVEREGQTVRVLEAEGIDRLTIRLDDTMVDLDRPVRVVFGDRVLFQGDLERHRLVLERTLAERLDPRGMYPTEVSVDLTAPTAD